MKAIDAIEESFENTKQAFFPVRLGYWMRMGIAGMFTGFGKAGGTSSGNYSRGTGSGPNLKSLSEFNTQALQFLGEYGFIVAAALFGIYLIGLFFTYISSVFEFVFIDGLVKKDIQLLKSFKEQRKLGNSLFALRFIMGILFFTVVLVLSSPLIMAFFSHDLATFNYWYLVPLGMFFIMFALAYSVFAFLVYDLAVPVMYLKNLNFAPAWSLLWNAAGKNKLEIFIYWLMKLVLSMVSGILMLFVVVVASMPFIAAVVLGGLVLYLLKNVLGLYMVLAVALPVVVVLSLLWLLVLLILSSPVSGFIRNYSLSMARKILQN